MTSHMIKKETKVDPVLSKVYTYVISCWPAGVVDPTLVLYKSKRNELTTQQGCLLGDTPVIVAPSLQEIVLEE